MSSIGSTVRFSLAAIFLGSAILNSSVSPAATVQINSSDNGWYNSSGSHAPTNTNIIVGMVNSVVHNNWLLFNVAAASGSTIVSGTVTFFPNNGQYGSFEPETYGLFDYTGSINNLLNGTGGISAFSDLGSGTSYGQAVVSAAFQGAPMPGFSVTLSPAALTAIATAAGSADQRFVIGGSLLSLLGFAPNEALFAFSGLMPAAQLTLEVQPAAAVPLGPANPFLTVGLGALALLAWRRKRKATALPAIAV